MIRNYIKVAFRNLKKSLGYSTINVLGLAVGLGVAMLIGLWIWDEMTYDHYFPNHKHLAQVMTTQTFNGNTGTGQAVAVPMGAELRNKHSDDFKYVSLASWNFDHILAVGEKKIKKNGMWAESYFPIMLGLKMVHGKANALSDPSSILLSKSMATALFGNADPINQTVRIDNRTDFKVAGVFEDMPRNTSFNNVEFFLPWEKYVSMEEWLKNAATQWGNHSFQLFVQLNENADFDKTINKIKGIPKEHGMDKDGKEETTLLAMDNWHLRNKFENGKFTGEGRIEFVWLFGIIGIFVLLLACINFMNLSTARSEKRAKEVGIRKTVGSLRQQLIGQFLSESIMVSLMALVLSLIFVLLSLSWFNQVASKEIHFPWAYPSFWILIVGFTVVTGLVSGSYPAFYLSGFDPVKVLKGTFKVGRYSSLPRKILVVVQFTVSIALIIGTIIVFRQVQHAKDRPVGYTREGLITVMMNTPEIYGHYNELKQDLLNTGVVANFAESSSPSTGVWSNQIGFNWKGKDPNSVPLFGIVAVTHDFGPTIDWKIKEGRDFSRDFADSGALILNESAVKLTGLKKVVGETIHWNDKDHQVVGVVKDMVMESPYTPIKPTIFFVEYGWANVITVRIKPTVPVREALSKIEQVFKRVNPGSPFEYQFTDEDYAKKFEDEERIGKLATVFAVLAIFISCLGLFGLASFVAEQRTKEIGVRKVLGASVLNLWGMLSKDFVMLVIISCLTSIPIAWYFLQKWLDKYEYRTSISWWIFAVAATGALVITLLTVSFQAIKAALANPVKSLRSE